MSPEFWLHGFKSRIELPETEIVVKIHNHFLTLSTQTRIELPLENKANLEDMEYLMVVAYNIDKFFESDLHVASIYVEVSETALSFLCGEHVEARYMIDMFEDSLLTAYSKWLNIPHSIWFNERDKSLIIKQNSKELTVYYNDRERIKNSMLFAMFFDRNDLPDLPIKTFIL